MKEKGTFALVYIMKSFSCWAFRLAEIIMEIWGKEERTGEMKNPMTTAYNS